RQLRRVDGKIAAVNEALGLGNDLVKAAPQLRSGAALDVNHAVIVLGHVLLELDDGVGLLALANPHELLAGKQKLDAAGVFGQSSKLPGSEARGLLVPAFIQTIPLVDLNIGGFRTPGD